MGTPAAEETNQSASSNPFVAAWTTGVAYARVPFKKHGNFACIGFATLVAALTSSLSCTVVAFFVAYWLAVCD